MQKLLVGIPLVLWLLGLIIPAPSFSAEVKTVVVVEKTIATVVTVEPIFLFVDCKGKEAVSAKSLDPSCAIVERKMFKYVVSLPNKQTLGYISPLTYSVGAQLIAERDDKGNWIIH